MTVAIAISLVSPSPSRSEALFVDALSRSGVAVPRNAVVDLDDPANIAAAMDRLGLEVAVLKPISGQS